MRNREFERGPRNEDPSKWGDFQFSTQVSAVVVQASASANATYRDGVAVFTIAKGGFMYEASGGGQKFTFKPKK